jgi:glycosyltransferase involved in cell wall biosynthesis
LKKVLIITYYWPPSGGVGVQRWLKFSKYLPEYGWNPVIYTPENPEILAFDDTLESQVSDDITVLRKPIWEPYSLYRKFLGKKNERIGAGLASEGGKEGWGKGLGIWIRGNLFIPDPRKFWIKPSVRFLEKYVKEEGIDHVITSGPPHSMHMIGLGLKRRTGIKWIADFRDPWTNIEFYSSLKLTRLADWWHHQLEQRVMNECDSLITVSPTWADEFRQSGVQKVDVVYNGYDEDDFTSEPLPVTNGFTLIHTGSFSITRNHPGLWQALTEVRAESDAIRHSLKFLTLGTVDKSVGSSIKESGLAEVWDEQGHRAHGKVMEVLRQSDVQLLVVNDLENGNGRLPSKLYEYLASGRPILCIGPPEGDAAKIIRQTNAGFCIGPSDVDGIKKSLVALYHSRGSVVSTKDISQFSRRNQAKNVAAALTEITE